MAVWNDFDKDDRVKKKAYSLAKHFNVIVQSVCKKPKVRPFKTYTENLTVKYYWFSSFFKWLWYRVVNNRNFWKDKIINCDIVDCNDPDTLWLGVLTKKKHGSDIVYDSHEYWKGTRRTESYFLYTLYSYIGNTLQYNREKKLVKHADRMICVSPTIKKILLQAYNKPISVIANMSSYVKDTDFDKQYSATFIGSYIRPGVEMVGEAFKKFGTLLVAIGGSPKGDWEKTGFLHKQEFRQKLHHQKFGICAYKTNCENIAYSLPNKIFEYIQAECPVIVTRDMIDVARIVEKEQIGVIVQSLTPVDIDFAVNELIINYDTYLTNIQNIKRKYCWEVQEGKFIKIYEDLVMGL